jgi:hypothetical protein
MAAPHTNLRLYASAEHYYIQPLGGGECLEVSRRTGTPRVRGDGCACAAAAPPQRNG